MFTSTDTLFKYMTMKRTATMLLAALLTTAMPLRAQQFSLPHGLYSQLTTLRLTPNNPDAQVYYTLDCSEPTAESLPYTSPIVLSKTTVVRAVEVKDGQPLGRSVTQTYVFAKSVIEQPAEPEGFPTRWGRFIQTRGTAPADYEMDPELTADDDVRAHIADALSELPLLSLVSDRDYFFGLDKDPDRGGIYIYTGAPIGNGDGRDWVRPCSVELMGGPQQHDLTTTCAITLHGGHGRVPEKNPKHSFRLSFKDEYGPSKLNYPVFGEEGVAEFNKLIVRTFFGNSWQHWKEDSRTRAQYTRDLWARQMQRRLGHPFADGIYVHLFIDGLYWGLYNLAERIDDSYCKEHFGGRKEDYDVVKVEELSGRQVVEAADGTLDKWDEMLSLVRRAATDDDSYFRLQGLDAQGQPDPTLEPLLNVDAFIDYMLINHYGGNTDWDIHNWYAFRNRTRADRGFQFICWDTESIFESLADNRLKLNNAGCPSEIFTCLMNNRHFQDRYVDRACQLLTGDGQLTEPHVVALWDSLYATIRNSLYAESARWGDYRRDVHPYSTRGQLYTVDGPFATERQRLLDDYFPRRSAQLLSDIRAMGWTSSGIAQVSAQPAPPTLYDLQGRRVAQPAPGRTLAPGIYVSRGRKIRIVR